MIEYRTEQQNGGFHTSSCREMVIKYIVKQKRDAQVLIHSEQLINRKHIVKNNYYFNLVKGNFSDIVTIGSFTTLANGREYLDLRVNTTQPFEMKTSLALFILTRDFDGKKRENIIEETLENFNDWFSRDIQRYRNGFLTAFVLFMILIKKDISNLELGRLPVEGVKSLGEKKGEKYKYFWPLIQEFSKKYNVALPDISSDFMGERVVFS